MVQYQGGGSGKLPPKAPAPVDPLAELKALLDANGVGANMGNMDYQAQAQAAYAPSFDYLDRAGNNARGNASSASNAIKRVYGQLANSINSQGAGIKRDYQQGITGVNNAYREALANSGQRFDQTNEESADILERLGIEQAGTNVLNKSNETERLLQGIVEANGLGAANALRQGRQSALTYNTQQGSAAKYAGAEAQQGIQKQLMDFLSNLEAKRAELGSQVNQYGLSLQSDAAKAAAAGGPNFDDMFKLKELEYRMAKDKADYDLNAAKITGNTDKLDPLGAVRQLAMNLYQGNGQAADNATDVVLRVASDMGSELGGGPITLEALMSRIRNTLMEKNGRVGDLPQLQRLAAEYMSQRG